MYRHWCRRGCGWKWFWRSDSHLSLWWTQTPTTRRNDELLYRKTDLKITVPGLIGEQVMNGNFIPSVNPISYVRWWSCLLNSSQEETIANTVSFWWMEAYTLIQAIPVPNAYLHTFNKIVFIHVNVLWFRCNRALLETLKRLNSYFMAPA